MLSRFYKSIRHCSTFNPVFPKPELNVNYLCDSKNFAEIEANIIRRKGVGNIKLVNELKAKLDRINANDESYNKIYTQFCEELFKIPNDTHPIVCQYGDDPKVVKVVNDTISFDSDVKEFHEITKRLNLVRSEQLGNLTGNRSYYILGEMVELEQALINYISDNLLKSNFKLISVPDILHKSTIESCGMNTCGTRSQVYFLKNDERSKDLCLSGTSEMALAGLYANKILSENDLPIKIMAVSRCYRAETSSTAEERGIYRVHEFTKVEMFVITTPEQSEEALAQILKIQEENFGSLEIQFQVLDMPAHELGAPAYRKYDIEAWMPGRNMYGEISSCSNCTDYQSRRLGIKYKTKDGDVRFAHTLNGTACAIPRLLIALTETGQKKNGTISIPLVLQKFMGNKTSISRQKRIPELRLIKFKKRS